MTSKALVGITLAALAHLGQERPQLQHKRIGDTNIGKVSSKKTGPISDYTDDRQDKDRSRRKKLTKIGLKAVYDHSHR